MTARFVDDHIPASSASESGRLSRHGSLVRNALFSALSWLSTFVFLLVLVLAARFLGVEAYGRFAFAAALVALFEVATDLGMRELLVREIARAPDRTSAWIGTALALKSVLAVISVAALGLIAFMLIDAPEVRLTILVLSVGMVAKSYKLLARAVLVAHELFQRETYAVSVDRGILLVATAAVLILDGRLLPFAMAFAGAQVAGSIVTWALLPPGLRAVRAPAGLNELWGLVRATLPFAITAAGFMVYFRIDSVMLAALRGAEEVGWYNAAYRLVEGLIVVPMLVQFAILPRLSQLHQEEPLAVRRLTRRAAKFLIAAAVVVAGLGTLEADRVVGLLYGAQYAHAVPSLRVLLVGVPFMFLWSLLTAVLNSTNRPLVPATGVLLGSLLNVVLNVFLIPVYGYLGASIATAAAEIFLFTFLLAFLAPTWRAPIALTDVPRPLVALIPAAAVSLLLADLGVLLTLFAGTAAFALTLHLTGFLDATERSALHEVVVRYAARFRAEQGVG